jgi:hypothetical protein
MDRESILAELQEVLASPHFCNSKRYPALLQFIVEKTLAGEADLLKERTLGVEVFDRSPSYDTNADTVVRYTAGEVRKRLSLYYHELGRKPRIRISLPAGSYVPEFLHETDLPGEVQAHLSAHIPNSGLLTEVEGEVRELDHVSPSALADGIPMSPTSAEERHGLLLAQNNVSARRRWHVALAMTLVIALLAGADWRYHVLHPRTALDSFWTPVLQNQSTVTVCIGGSVFSQTHTSGVATATKDVDYPFVSMQSVSAVAQLSALLASNGGATTTLQGAATTPLTELKERPAILLGAYNNQWTLRLVQPLRFHFAPPEAGAEGIVDAAQPGMHWERDEMLPYSNEDDYALVARFHDTTTDSWVVVLAGVGRNGTEAAAQFATSPHYMQLLRDQAGTDFASHNVEVVLKVTVIDGKTGAPSILAVHLW